MRIRTSATAAIVTLVAAVVAGPSRFGFSDRVERHLFPEVTTGPSAYAPDDGFARAIAVSETHYFHSTGTFEVAVPAGLVTIEALRGFEFVPASASVGRKAGSPGSCTRTRAPRRIRPGGAGR